MSDEEPSKLLDDRVQERMTRDVEKLVASWHRDGITYLDSVKFLTLWLAHMAMSQPDAKTALATLHEKLDSFASGIRRLRQSSSYGKVPS